MNNRVLRSKCKEERTRPVTRTSDNRVSRKSDVHISMRKDSCMIRTPEAQPSRFEEQASDVDERVCFMQSIPKDEIPIFMKGKRLDRVISVKGDSGVFTLPNSFGLIILKDSKFHDGGVSRNKGNIKTMRNKDKLLSVGTISVHVKMKNCFEWLSFLTLIKVLRRKLR